jgi:hypothetical protein
MWRGAEIVAAIAAAADAFMEVSPSMAEDQSTDANEGPRGEEESGQPAGEGQKMMIFRVVGRPHRMQIPSKRPPPVYEFPLIPSGPNLFVP